MADNYIRVYHGKALFRFYRQFLRPFDASSFASWELDALLVVHPVTDPKHVFLLHSIGLLESVSNETRNEHYYVEILQRS